MERSLEEFFEAAREQIVQIERFYREDRRPWILATSYGKDSSAVLQLVWLAVSKVPVEQRHKPVIVLTSDTGVENPLMWSWVRNCVEQVNEAARLQQMPFQGFLNQPDVSRRFWACLIGKGYSRPSPTFRWCTGRLKILPNTEYIQQLTQGREAIIFLGMRTDESSLRAQSVAKLRSREIAEKLVPSEEIRGAFNYVPICDWTTAETWLFLMQFPTGWRESNRELRELYARFSTENECPLVVNAATTPCGARTGCFTCTVVSRDRSFEAAIEDDPTTEWMLPLLDLRNELAEPDREKRDFRRNNGKIYFYEKKGKGGVIETLPIPGPYLKEWRHHYLRRVLEVQHHIESNAPKPYCESYQIITSEELSEIRRIWRDEKAEFEDALPKIYREVMGHEFIDPATALGDRLLDGEDYEVLQQVCNEVGTDINLMARLLSTEEKYSYRSRRGGRRGIYETLATIVDRFGRDREAGIACELNRRALRQAKTKQLNLGAIDTHNS